MILWGTAKEMPKKFSMTIYGGGGGVYQLKTESKQLCDPLMGDDPPVEKHRIEGPRKLCALVS